MEITPGHLCFSLPSQDGPVPGTTERLGIFLPSCQGARGLWGHCKARSRLAPRGTPVRHQLTQLVPLGTPAPTSRGAAPGEGQMDPPLPEAPAPPLAYLDTGQNLNTQGLASVHEMMIFHFSPNWTTA